MEYFDESEWKRRQLERIDEARFQGRAERAARSIIHGIIPQHFFSAASSECRELFVDGHFYGCISLAQAVAEGLTRFLGRFHQIGARKNPLLRSSKLYDAGIISQEALQALKRIRGNDRDIFHHMNDNIPTDSKVLEARAEECVDALYTVESEVFEFQTRDGTIVPKNPQYWPRSAPEYVQTCLRLGGH
jgi:hypothetical protein